MPQYILVWLIFSPLLLIGVFWIVCSWVSNTSYRCGVKDGFNYAQQPQNPRYYQAARIIDNHLHSLRNDGWEDKN